MCQVEFFVGQQARTSEIGGTNDSSDGIEALEATSTIEKIALGMQETTHVEAHLHMFLAQKGDEVFDQAKGLFVKVFSGQVTDEPLDGFRASFAQAEIRACFRFVTEQQAEVAEAVETFTQELPATGVEVGGGDVERMAFMIGQEVIEDVGHFVLLVVDDEWDGHEIPSVCWVY